MESTHREQANQHLGSQITHVSRGFSGQSQSGGDSYSETTTSVYANVRDISDVSGVDIGLEQIGEIPDDGLVVKVAEPVDVETDDQFEIEGDRYDILNLRKMRGERGKQTYWVAYCKPDRSE